MEKSTKILILIFLLSLGFRLYFAFQTPYFSYDAYFNYRQINAITETGLPVFNDPLSYGGRVFVFIPSFHYIMAFFNLLLPGIALKLIPNVLASLLPIIVYLISKEITKNENASLVSAFVSVFIPVFTAETFNSLSTDTLVIPFTFLAIYFFLNLEHKRFVNYYLASIIILPFTHQLALLIVLSLIFYLVLLRLEKIPSEKSETELILFTVFFVIWIQFLIFKNSFLEYGPSLIWQNIPQEVLSLYFTKTTISEAVVFVGLMPLICGIYVIYNSLVKEKNKDIFFLISFGISTGLLLWLQMIQATTGFAFLGVIFALFFAQFYKITFAYLKQTKFIVYKKYISLALLFIFLVTSILPSYNLVIGRLGNAPSEAEMNTMIWLKEHVDEESSVLAALNLGHLVTAVAERKNIIDTNFLSANEPSQRLADVNTIYTTQAKIQAVEILEEYDIDYIVDSAKSKFGKLSYVDDKECFRVSYTNEEVVIYRPICEVEEAK